MNKLLSDALVRIKSEDRFLSFLINSKNESESFSSNYLIRRRNGLIFSLLEKTGRDKLEDVEVSLSAAKEWNGLVFQASEKDNSENIFSPEAQTLSYIRPFTEKATDSKPLVFFNFQEARAINSTPDHPVTFKAAGFITSLESHFDKINCSRYENIISGKVTRLKYMEGCSERSFSIEDHWELELETDFGTLAAIAPEKCFSGEELGQRLVCRCLLSAAFSEGKDALKLDLLSKIYSFIHGSLNTRRPERFHSFFTDKCSFHFGADLLIKNRGTGTFSQFPGTCHYIKAAPKNNRAIIRGREYVLLWKTSLGDFVLAFDVYQYGIQAVYIDSASNYRLEEYKTFSELPAR